MGGGVGGGGGGGGLNLSVFKVSGFVSSGRHCKDSEAGPPAQKYCNMQFTESGNELPEEVVTLRSKHLMDGDDGPLPIKSTVGMVLDGLTVSMTIPGEMCLLMVFLAYPLTIPLYMAQAPQLPGV